MKYCLDTITCIHHLCGSAPALSARLEETPFRNICIPSMVAAELFYGAWKSTKREYNLKIIQTFLSLYEITVFDKVVAEVYGAIRSELVSKGQMIGGNDLVIAATAMSCDAVLVSHNVGELSRIAGLRIEDWTEISK